MVDATGRTDYGLAPAPGHSPVTIDFDPCDGTFTCQCRRCVSQRSTLVRLGPRREVRQPWEPLRAA